LSFWETDYVVGKLTHCEVLPKPDHAEADDRAGLVINHGAVEPTPAYEASSSGQSVPILTTLVRDRAESNNAAARRQRLIYSLHNDDTWKILLMRLKDRSTALDDRASGDQGNFPRANLNGSAFLVSGVTSQAIA
jgi:hypothetical protein